MAEFLASNGKYLAVLLGIAAGFALVWRKREALKLKRPWQITLVCLIFSAFSVLSAILFAALESLIGGQAPSFGAISTYGIYLICPFLLFLSAKAAKRDLKTVFDTYALYAMPSLFLLRCNCLQSGCCGGRPILGSELRWPTREAEMIFYVAMLLLLLRRERRGAPPGTAFPLLMFSYGAFRFVEEWFREGSGASFVHLAHLWSVIALIVGLGLFLELSKTSQKERRSSKC